MARRSRTRQSLEEEKRVVETAFLTDILQYIMSIFGDPPLHKNCI